MNLIEQAKLATEIEEQISRIDLFGRMNTEEVNKMIKALGGDLEADTMSDINTIFYYISLLFMREQLK